MLSGFRQETDAARFCQGSDFTTLSRAAAPAETRLMTLLLRPALLQAAQLDATLALVADVSFHCVA